MRWLIATSLLTLVLVACGRAAEVIPDTPTPADPTSTPSLEPSAGEGPLSPVPTVTPAPREPVSPLPVPESSPLEPPSEARDRVVAAAKAHLAAELGVPSGSIEAIAIEPVEWSDASLGCPTPGVVYAQVVTPGYRIVLEVDAKEYELHTDKSGRAVVVCERELEKGPIAAVEYLANELGISAEGVEVLSVDAYEWPDAGLGCPEPGRSYAQVLTPGYRVIVEAAGEQHEVHTDREGEIIVICEPEP